MIEDANLIGINSAVYKHPLAEAELRANRMGLTVYHAPLSRPTLNVTWFLLLDFGTGIQFAAFADHLDFGSSDYPDNPENNSYEAFVQNRDRFLRQEKQLKTQRLRSIREQFLNDNDIIIQDMRIARAALDNVRDSLAKIDTDFDALTTISDGNSGLSVQKYSQLGRHFEGYLSNLLREGTDMVTARKQTLQQRLAAREKYYERVELAQQGTELFRRIRFCNEDLAQRRDRTARQLGLVNPDKPLVL